MPGDEGGVLPGEAVGDGVRADGEDKDFVLGNAVEIAAFPDFPLFREAGGRERENSPLGGKRI